MPQRLISADDHVDLSRDKIKSFLDPQVPRRLQPGAQGVPAAERELILSGNAARVWNL